MEFDPIVYKSSTKAQWDTVAAHWNAWGGLLDKWLGPATETLMDMCQVGPGSRVLHVAGGSGQEALQTALRVGSTGSVVTTDFSEELTMLAAANFKSENIAWAQSLVMDGENVDLEEEPFDAVLSRVGLIFFPDQLGSVRSQIAALKPGGHVGALVYSTPQECRFFSDPVAVIRKHAGLLPPAPGLPGPFSLGQPGAIETLFEAAGLINVKAQKIEAPVLLGSAQDCLRFEQESFGALHQMLSNLSDDAKALAWREVETSLEAFEGEDGFIGPCTMIAASGQKSS